jgi:hypothetical protein
MINKNNNRITAKHEKTKKNKTLKNPRTTKTEKIKNNVFKNEDFNDKSGFQTGIWGPVLWFYLHIMSFNYPNNPTQTQKNHYKDFIYNLRFVLPCKYCRINLINNLKEHPITNNDLKNRETFSRYIYNLHNIINKMLNKKIKISYEEVRDKYEHFRARCNDVNNVNENKNNENNKNKENENKDNENDKNKKIKNMHKKGCTIPLTGVKSKCVLRIVPKEKEIETLKISNKCLKKRKTIKNKK